MYVISAWLQNIVWKMGLRHDLQIAILSATFQGRKTYVWELSYMHCIYVCYASVCVKSICSAEWCSVYWANSKQSATSPKTSQALTVTQRTVQNTCWDDGDGWQPRQHMGLILALIKTTWHKYRTKRTTLETRTVPLQCFWHWHKHLIIPGVMREEKGEQKRGEKAEFGV